MRLASASRSPTSSGMSYCHGTGQPHSRAMSKLNSACRRTRPSEPRSEANRFAADLLVPSAWLAGLIESRGAQIGHLMGAWGSQALAQARPSILLRAAAVSPRGSIVSRTREKCSDSGREAWSGGSSHELSGGLWAPPTTASYSVGATPRMSCTSGFALRSRSHAAFPPQYSTILSSSSGCGSAHERWLRDPDPGSDFDEPDAARLHDEARLRCAMGPAPRGDDGRRGTSAVDADQLIAPVPARISTAAPSATR